MIAELIAPTTNNSKTAFKDHPLSVKQIGNSIAIIAMTHLFSLHRTHDLLDNYLDLSEQSIARFEVTLIALCQI